MKRFDVIKTIQLIVLVLLAAIGLFVILRDPELYEMMAVNGHVRLLGFLLWILLGLSFLFLLYDFTSWSDLRRENMELDNAIYNDALTGIANRYSVDVYIGRFLNQPLPQDMGCVTLEITNLREINERLGHTGGDTALQVFSDILQEAAGGVCFIGRNGGNKFLAIFRECSEKRVERFLEEIERGIAAHAKAHPDMPLVYRKGVALAQGSGADSVTALVALSDSRARAEGRA